jgi:hypothetical protein
MFTFVCCAAVYKEHPSHALFLVQKFVPADINYETRTHTIAQSMLPGEEANANVLKFICDMTSYLSFYHVSQRKLGVVLISDNLNLPI